MANYPAIIHLRPEVRDFIRNRVWVHRGEAISYGPNIRCNSFSTDGNGFRHSTFDGKEYSVGDCLKSERYGLVLGPSNVYGFGLAGNEKTLPSLLAERFGFPFANVGLPEGNSRNLFALLLGIVARSSRPPSAVVHISGGDFTNFCYTASADPMFGSPNLKQVGMVLKERGGKPHAEQQMPALLAFTSLWIRTIADLCRANQIPLVLADDTTFFEKARPNKIEKESELGNPFNAAQAQQFDTHKRFVADYHTRRKTVAEKLRVPLAGPGITNKLGFIDEFHYDADGTRDLVNDFAKALEPLLK